jgi:hypothetical protein
MADKSVSKHLIALEKQFAATDPVLQKTAKVFQELDELEFELGLLDNDETTARKVSWWPLISTLGGYSPAKSEFINHYLGVNFHSARHKFTVLQYTPQTNTATLPGTALDADHRLPFYQISRDIDQVATGEGSRLNTYLELITVNSTLLKNKLIIDTPVLNSATENPITALLRKHVIDISDLVLVFTDLFEADNDLIGEVITNIVAQQDSNKFIFIIDHSEISLDAHKSQEIASAWQRRLAEFGIHTGQFIVLSQGSDTLTLSQRINNLNNDRTYRILANLETSIRNIDDLIIDEVESAITLWKERCNASTLIILGFIIMLVIFAEIAGGVLDLLFDPITGPIILLTVIAVLTPIHLITSRFHAKLIINQLHKRQKQLNISEDLSGLFEKSLGFWRTLLPITTPVGKNKKTRKRLAAMLEESKDLVQTLNDQFSHNQQRDYHAQFESNSVSEEF